MTSSSFVTQMSLYTYKGKMAWNELRNYTFFLLQTCQAVAHMYVELCILVVTTHTSFTYTRSKILNLGEYQLLYICIRKLNAVYQEIKCLGKKIIVLCDFFCYPRPRTHLKPCLYPPPPPNDTYTVHLFSALVVTIRVTTEEDKTPRKPSANFRAIPVRDTTWTT